MISHLVPRTPEQLAEMREKALATRLAKAEAREANKGSLKLSYLDEGHWATLATKLRIRMPHAEEQADMPTLRKYLKKAKVEMDTFKEHYTSGPYFLAQNPTWTKYALAGLILELA